MLSLSCLHQAKPTTVKVPCLTIAPPPRPSATFTVCAPDKVCMDKAVAAKVLLYLKASFPWMTDAWHLCGKKQIEEFTLLFKSEDTNGLGN
jgi:hypothetical protein